MYCPNCAASIDGAKFCRSCGTNVSLVPQALTGQLPVVAPEEGEMTGQGKRKSRKLPTIEKAVGNVFTGIGFLVAALFVTFWFPAGVTWGWALLFPAFGMIGEGIGQYMKVKQLERERLYALELSARGVVPANYPPAVSQVPRVSELSVPTTSELQTPSSIVEHTTKHLDRQR